MFEKLVVSAIFFVVLCFAGAGCFTGGDRVGVVHKIDVTGLPFTGSPDAPVTVVVFSDYQ